MPEITYKSLKNHVEEKKFASVYLIYGEEFLYKSALEVLLDALLTGSSRTLNHDPLDGAGENIQEAIERMNTYSLLSGSKVVSLGDSRIFYAKKDEEELLERTREAWENEELQRAARYFLNLLGRLDLTLDEVRDSDSIKKLPLASDKAADHQWVDKLVEYCREKGLSIPAGGSDAGILREAVENGFPRGNHLIITADLVDKRQSLFKVIKKHGVVIDCSVPRSERRADKMAQEAVLKETFKNRLKNRGKKLDQLAYSAMYEMTGFDLRTFFNNLEKLMDYVGDRQTITVDDVESVLSKTKIDPVYELTNAISDRHVENAIHYLDSLLSGSVHPLQALAGITSLIRRLLLIKDFMESPHGGGWVSDCVYMHFQDRVMPAAQRYDGELASILKDWQNDTLASLDSDSGKTAREGKSAYSNTDLQVAKNIKNPYPIFQMMKKSDNFSKNELIQTMIDLSEADLKLKSSAQDPQRVLESVIYRICRNPLKKGS